jgi:hypothetical protein
MKKVMFFGLILAMAAVVFAEDGLTVSGHVKTGLNITKLGDKDATVDIKHTDDGGDPGRIRLNWVYTNGIVQFKWRNQLTGQQWAFVEDLVPSTSGNVPVGEHFQTTLDNLFDYAFAMGDFLDDQIRVSLGKLGDSGDRPWEIGGDEIWADIEGISGVRFEFKPAAVKGLDVGFLLPALTKPVDGGDYFSELGFGARYDNDAIDIRVAARLDSDYDKNSYDGTKLIWLFNPKIIGTAVDGLSVWANGQVLGIKTYDEVPDSAFNTLSWLYFKYAKGNLTSATLRLGLETWADDDLHTNDTLMGFYLKPVFGYKLTDWAEAGLVIQATLYPSYADGYKVGAEDPSMFDKLFVEPSVNFTLPGGFSIKPVYQLTFNAANGPSAAGKDSRIDHTFELRLQYDF